MDTRDARVTLCAAVTTAGSSELTSTLRMTAVRNRRLPSNPPASLQSSTDRNNRGGVPGLAGDLVATPAGLVGRPGRGSALESAGTIICLRTRRESASILSATFYK